MIRWPEMTTTCFVNICPVLLSNKRPARTATTRGAGGHCKIPPSDPTHGGYPAPRQGVVSGFGCAPSTAVKSPASIRTLDCIALILSHWQASDRLERAISYEAG